MKFGCLYYADSDNIGDDIQTYAQWKFLPKVDYWIDRESLNLFCPNENSKVALIMNAWFMYSPQNWPPSPYISPLFVSTHFSKYHVQWLKAKKDEYAFAQEYLRENGPIGCRDASTLQTLQGLGIDAYFSGCLTLTLKPFPDIEKQEYICLVDVSQNIVDYVKKKGYDVRVMSHNQKNAARMAPKDRLKQAEKYLKIYQAARCVLTSRLHCALPCTGLKTPALVFYAPEYEERFSALKEFFYTTSEEEFLQGKWDGFLREPLYHPTEYLQYTNSLAEKCEKFVEDAIKKEEPVNIDYERYKKMSILQNVIQKETYIAELHRLSEGYMEERTIINDLHNTLDLKETENHQLKEKHNQLYAEHDQLRGEYDRLHTEHDKLRREYDQLHAEYNRLKEEHNRLHENYGKLQEKQEILCFRYAKLHDYAGRLRRLRADALCLLREEERKGGRKTI